MMQTGRNKTILVVDDTESNLDMVLAILQDYDLIPSTSGEDALELLKEEKVDLVLLDILMPGLDGYDVCKRIKSAPETQDIPVIFITAKTNEQSIEKAYELGGADYVTKPFKPKELLARVKVQLKLQDVIRELDFLANHDTMTGLLNRRKFFEIGDALFQKSADDLYALMVDIDHFKAINDSHGHHIGDVALKKVTAVISEILPSDSVFGRMGGEEFAALFTCQTNDQAKEIASDIRQAVEQTKIPLGCDDDAFISCTISIGITCKQPAFTTLDSLLRKADAALYEAKEGGRNRSVYRSR